MRTGQNPICCRAAVICPACKTILQKPFRESSVVVIGMEKNDNPTPVSTHQQQPVLLEGVDYYIEKGRWVFTERYLLDRGDCCGSGCRHCPYRHRNVRGKGV